MSSRRPWPRLPIWTVVTILLTAGPLGYGGRDFGVFLIIFLFYSPALALACLALLLIATFGRPDGTRRSALLSFAMILLLTPATLKTVADLRDRIDFTFWYPAHHTLVDAWEKQRGVIMHWDGWGFGGISSDSFLVSDPADTLAKDKNTAAVLTRCDARLCGVAKVEAMRPGLYIVTINY